MQLSNIPGKLVLPFANGGGKNTIPVASQIGITAGAASLVDGFPPLTRTPIAAGGVPPSGLDMNGVLYELSAVIRWANAGGGYPFDNTFATDTNVGGYPKGARIMRADGAGYWYNTTDNNVTDPESSGAAASGWVPDFTTGVAAVTMISANVTLTPAQYGKPIVVIGGTLTANLNLIFPEIVGNWLIINNTTGGFTIGIKTAASLAVNIPNGYVGKFYCDGSDILIGDTLYIPSAVGSVATTVSKVLDDSIYITRFPGIDPTGATDSTAGFYLAQYWASTIKGGRVRVPVGTYMLTNFDVDQQNLIFEGEMSGYAYSETDMPVKIIPGPGALYAARLKGTRSGVIINAAEGSGFKNIQFLDPSVGTCEYGLFIDSGATVLESVQIQGFQYGCVIADQANANIFKKVNILLNTKVGFAVTESQAWSYMHPGISGATSVSNTTFSMEDCNIRQNGFGMVLRSASGASFNNLVIESNKQAGLYLYRPDVATLRSLDWANIHLENNYEDYVSGDTSYSISDNRMLWIGASTPIAWTSVYQAGYQMVIDSQTHFGGGADTFAFWQSKFNCAGTQQKSILILSGYKFDFYKPVFTGGDTLNLVRITNDANAVHWHDPLAGNDPTAPVVSITNSFGTNSGNRGAYYKSGTSFGTAELGGVYPILGITGGPVHFLTPVPGDPRHADIRCLDDYFEGDNTYVVPWRVGAALPFTVNSQTTSVTKIGRQVHVEMVANVTVAAPTLTTDKLYTGAGLPYAAATTGNLVGKAWVQATGGGATVLNGGVCDMWMDTVASLYGVVDVFPILAIGMTYSIKVSATYTAET